MAVQRVTDAEYEVPADEEPAARCPYCDRPFKSTEYATFHVGVSHPEECTEAERDRFEEARDDEEYDLFTFHVKATVGVLFTYFMFTFMYALIWSG